VPFLSFCFVLFCLIFGFFYGMFVRFSTRGVQKHHKFSFGEKKVERKQFFFPVVFFLQLDFIAFGPWAVSLHEELKNTITIFSKIRPENLKKPPKK
jgi:hypothetical protein